MKKLVFVLMMVVIFAMGCSVEKSAEKKLESAIAQLQAGNEEGVKGVEEVAQKYPETKAGQKAIAVIKEMEASQSKAKDVVAQSDLRNLSTIFAMIDSEKDRYPRSAAEFSKGIEQPVQAPSGDLGKYKEAPKTHITEKDVKAVALVAANGEAYEICTYHVEGETAFCCSSSAQEIFEVPLNKGVIEDLTSKGSPAGEVEGLKILVKK